MGDVDWWLCAPSWCLRGIEWVGRKVFERGYWKFGEERRAEIKILDKDEGGEVTDSIIEDKDTNDNVQWKDVAKRWIRIVRCAVGIVGVVNGFRWVEGTRSWSVEGDLKREGMASTQRGREKMTGQDSMG